MQHRADAAPQLGPAQPEQIRRQQIGEAQMQHESGQHAPPGQRRRVTRAADAQGRKAQMAEHQHPVEAEIGDAGDGNNDHDDARSLHGRDVVAQRELQHAGRHAPGEGGFVLQGERHDLRRLVERAEQRIDMDQHQDDRDRCQNRDEQAGCKRPAQARMYRRRRVHGRRSAGC
ncbi:MAG: hypothetical protein WDN69_08575 [Aliidongia sp.]